MIIKNAKVFYHGSFQSLEVKVKDDVITSICPLITPESGEEVIDGNGMLLLPGFIDIHSHGCVGFDFTTATTDEIETMRKFYLANGITSVLATTMTIDLPTYRTAVSNIGTAMKQESEGSHLLGINMEGPFFSPAKKGAHDERYLLPPTNEVFDELDKLSGNHIVLIDVDPTLENALPFIRTYKEKGKVISLAHTPCDYELACEAVKAGADHITHLFNAMNGLHHRAPGLLGALSDNEMFAEMICDGIHIHPSVIRMMFKLSPEKLILISDSMSAAGLEDGFYELGGQKVCVKDSKATLEDGTIAGSTVTVYEALKRTVSFGVPLEKALLSATLIPARSIHMEDIVGSIEVGKRADLILSDPALNLKQIWKSGKNVK